MGEISSTGTKKTVYYKVEDLTKEEKQRFYIFEPMLTESQLSQIHDWCDATIFNFALIDEDYIFFTTKDDYHKFVAFWDNLSK